MFLTALFICSLAAPSTAQNPNFGWALSFGASSSDYALDVAVDGDGNSYSCGYFQGTVDFNPGLGTANLTSAGNNDIFLAKYDSLGNYLWAIALGGSSNDRAYELKLDTSNNIYITGLST